jgi:hypothetical protein
MASKSIEVLLGEKNMKRKFGILLIVILLVTGLGGVVYAQEPPSSSVDPEIDAQGSLGTEFVLPAGASPVITFSEYPLYTYITNQYQDVGIIFGGDDPYITNDGAMPTSPVLTAAVPDGYVFGGDITGTFVVPGTDTPTTVCAFGLLAGYLDYIGSTYIEWFDPDGIRLGKIYNSATGVWNFTVEGGNIASWRICGKEDPVPEPAGFSIDNVWFEPCPPPPLPPSCIYLHCEDGLFNLTEPVGTQWDELYPLFGRDYHLSSWEDNGDGILSYCDTIDMYEKPDGEPRDYHVENVTITLYLTPELNTLIISDGFGVHLLGEPPMYVELEGGYDPAALTDPIGTQWHEIYPDFCTPYNLTAWDDNTNGVLDFCDYILLTDKESGNFTSWHVEDVAIDILVCREPPPVGGEAYPVDKISLLAPWIAMAVLLAGGVSWLALRRRKTQS